MSSTGKGIDLSGPLSAHEKEALLARLDDRSIAIGDCLVWTGWKRNDQGHGGMSVGNRPTWVHQIAYAIHHGPIPLGMVVRHRCDNPPCIAAAHLTLGTQRENVHDMIERGRIRRRVRRPAA